MESKDCYGTDQKSLCKKLLNSLINFQVYSHEKKIRVALAPPLNVTVSLNLTVLHGPCEVSCEGDINSCEISTEDHFWSDPSSPFYLENCISSHNYCVTATIGECCPICTSSVFVEDHKKEYYYEDEWQWSTEVAVVIIISLILVSFCFVSILRNYFTRGLKCSSQKPQNIMENQLTQPILEIESNQQKSQLVCLYLRENNPLFLDMVKSLQEFLRRKCVNVIDIYEEEDSINCSVTKWVQNIIKEEKAKILICESDNIQQLWNGTIDRNNILKPLEQMIHFTRSCIPITNVHNYLFFVRFQELYSDEKRFFDLSDGRCYVYPIHRERLATDIKS